MVSDEILILEFQRGSREAFAELFARHRQALYAFFRRRLESPERAEELTQETFLAVIRASTRYQPRSLVRNYLYGIAWNLLSHERRQKGAGAFARQPLPADPASNPSEDALWVRQALEKLDPTDREILMLREYEQRSYLEIANLLSVPNNTVRSRLFRARLALKACLEPGNL